MNLKKVSRSIVNLFRNLDWKATRVFLRHPLFVIPTIWSTVESIVTAEEKFDERPEGNGLANAYRHAVWNLLIAHYCSKVSSVEKAVKWSKEITDLHEEIFPNRKFDKEMDLHNNSVGRLIFEQARKSGLKSKKDLFFCLDRRVKSAAGLSEEREFEKFPEDLVYFLRSSN